MASDHDYEPGDTTHPMSTDPDCRICGETRRTCEGNRTSIPISPSYYTYRIHTGDC
jgi:hypothetical protein